MSAPDRPPGAPTGLVAASIGRRIGANLIDGALVLAAYVVILVLLVLTAQYGSASAVLLLVLVGGPAYAIYTWYRLAVHGTSIGKQLLGLKLVSVHDGTPIGWGRVFLRQLVLGVVSTFTFGLGLIVLAVVAANDRTGRNRGWHDQVAESMVIDLRAERDRPPTPGRSPAPVVAPSPRSTPVALPSGGAGAPLQVPAPIYSLPISPTAAVPPSREAPYPAAGDRWPDLARADHVAPPTPTVPAVMTVTEASSSTPSGGLIAAVPGVSSGLLPAAPEPSAPLAPAAIEPTDALDFTRLVPARVGPKSWRLRVDDGQEVAVTGDGLLGRAPEPRAGEHVTHLVAVADPERSVSKTHLAFGLGGQGFWVCDHGSTNGTTLVDRDGAESSCPAGEQVYVEDGTTIRFGQQSMRLMRH